MEAQGGDHGKEGATVPTLSRAISMPVDIAGMQKGLRSDFDMAYERGRISVSAEEGAPTPPAFTRSVSQDQRERKSVTVDEVPSGVYLYPEEEGGMEKLLWDAATGAASASLFEEAQKEILKLMQLEDPNLLIGRVTPTPRQSRGGMQKGLRSDFDMAYERGRISVSAEEGAPTPPAFTRSVSQDQRERKSVTVDEVPSGVYLYPEEEGGMENCYGTLHGRASASLFEEAQKEILKLMQLERQLSILIRRRMPPLTFAAALVPDSDGRRKPSQSF
ncbi:hypothetical protein SKAU_G00119310 [Synaphobranchus kaupii]|uniref:Uncharacterized protein n=1 Tax=Synaphobranchus kaupii TaxID=118154 RepID=A0A9Q1FN97_SYNKA|nr:hypothetical protein SKAU_G00119310 [Synaphobranchus kaupii]